LHYREGNYQAAIDEYLKITGAGVANEWVFFNLGNAYYKENRTGNAILYYEKALRLAPGDSQIRENLALARSRTIDKLSSPAEPFGLRLVKWFFIRLTIDQETALALVLFVAANLLFSLVFIRKPDPVRRWLLAVCLAFSFLTLLFFASNVLRIQHEIRHVFAIVLVEKADVQSGPEADNALLFSIHEGAKVEIREELGEWVQIGLENGWAGWMPRKALSMI
jgi:tetratricopeptide (TPR) repeat protein